MNRDMFGNDLTVGDSFGTPRSPMTTTATTRSVCILTGAKDEDPNDHDAHRHRIESTEPPRRAGAGEQWRIVRLGRNTYIERDGDSPFVCDMQTYDCSDAERAEAVELASEIVKRYQTHATLIAALEQAQKMNQYIVELSDGASVDNARRQAQQALIVIEEALQKARE